MAPFRLIRFVMSLPLILAFFASVSFNCNTREPRVPGADECYATATVSARYQIPASQTVLALSI
jgi:hypothetical protein